MPNQAVKEIEARFRANTSAYRQEIAQAGKITNGLKQQIQQASAELSQAGGAAGKQGAAISRSLNGAQKAAERISKSAQTLVGKERELSRAVEEQKKRLADLQGEYQRLSGDVSRLNGVYDTIKEATKGLDLSTPLAKQREQASAEMDRLEQEIRTLQANLASAGKGGLVPVGDTFIGMDEAKARLQELIAASDQAAERFWKLDDAISAIGEENLGFASKTGLKQLQTEIGKYQSRMSQLEMQAGQTESRLTTYTERLEDVRRGEEQLGEATERLSEQVTELGSTAAGMAAAQSAVSQQSEQSAGSAEAYAEELEKARQEQESLTESAKKAVSPLSRIGAAFSRAGETISAGITAKLKEGAQGFFHLGSSARSGGKSVLSSAATMAKAMIGVRSLYMLIRKLKSAFTGGLKELANYSAEVKNSLGSMSAAMGQMNNSIATAFSPLVNVAAPYITTFIQHVADAFNAVGAFFAAITGQNSYTRAVYNYKGVSDAAGDAASATHDAAEAQKELNRQLMGFDEINKLNDNSGGSGGGGAIGGSGAGSGSGNGMSFVTESIPGLMSSWSEKFKEAWANADFTEIGGIFGEKLRDALDKIPWEEKLKPGAQKIAGSLATLFNGFLETEGLSTSIGNTVAEAFNTGFEFVNTYLEKFHFDSFGKFISSGIQAALERFEWSQIGRTASNLLTGAFDFGQGFLDGVRWDDLGGTIYNAAKDVVTNIKYSDISEKFFELFGAAIKAGNNLISGFFGSISDDVQKWALDEMGEVDYRKILTAFWNGFKGAVNLSRPAINFFEDFNIPNPFTDAFKTWDLVSSVWTALAPLEDNKTWDKFTNNVSGAIKYAFEHGAELAQGVINGLKTWLSGLSLDLNFFDGDGLGIDQKISLKAAITGEIVNAVDKTNGSGVIDNVTGKLTKARDNTSGKGVVGGVTGSVTKTEDKTGGKGVVGGVTGKLTKAQDSTKGKGVVGGVTATFTKFADKIAKTKKIINNLIAIAPKLTLKDNKVKVKAYSDAITGAGGGRGHTKAKGGVFQHGRWSDIPQYAGGTLNAGTVFAAGENGPEIVGHIGGRTEVLNKSQIASAVYSAMVSAIGQYKSYFSSITSNIAQIPRAITQVSVQRESVPVSVVGGGTYSRSDNSASFASAVAKTLSELTGGKGSVGGNQPIVVQVVLDGRVVAESTLREFQGMKREGRDPLAGFV